MSIKPIEAIPLNPRKKSARDMIRADIQEAIDNGISMFEFEGDYNYKTLAGNANNVIKYMIRSEVHRIQNDFRQEYYTEQEKKIRGFHTWFKSYFEYRDYWIRISSMKGETRQRVFCEIKDRNDFEKTVIEDCKKALNKSRAEHVLIDGKWERKTE